MNDYYDHDFESEYQEDQMIDNIIYNQDHSTELTKNFLVCPHCDKFVLEDRHTLELAKSGDDLEVCPFCGFNFFAELEEE